MIKKEDINFQSPRTLFKYCSVNANTFSSLINKTVYMARVSQLNDPFECDLDCVDDMTEEDIFKILDDNIYESSEHVHIRVESIKKGIEKYLNEILILSLSATPYENLMWSHYADEHRGICIEYDRGGCKYLSDLTVCFPVDYPKESRRNKIKIKNVVRNELSDLDFIMRAITSRKESVWAYEKEWRLVLNHKDNVQLLHDTLRIKSITFGLRTPSHQKMAIFKLLEQEEINFYQAYKDKNELMIRIKSFNPDNDVEPFMSPIFA